MAKKNVASDRKVRIGIVGSKFAASFHADSYRRNEHAELAAIAAIDNLPEFSKQWNSSHRIPPPCDSAA
jgi:predicted dehydrogenase